MRPLTGVTVAIVAALTVTATGCSPSSVPVVVVGTVTDPSRTVVVPTLTTPSVNLDAGFVASPGSTAPGSSTSTSASPSGSTANTLGLVYQLGTTQRVAAVRVHEGSMVSVGQPLATLDTAALKAQVQATQADQKVAWANVDVLTQAINDTYSAQRTVEANRTKVSTAITTVNSNLATLKQAKPQLIQTRADLAAKLAQAEYLLAHYPPVPPPCTPTKPQLQAAIAQLQATIASLDAKLAQINAAIPQLTAGLTKARAGLAKLNSALGTLRDARAQLRGLRDLARIAADTADIPVSIARAQLDQATLTAPVTGVVTWVAGVGDRLDTGAPVAVIRTGGPAKVTAWLAPSQLSQVCAGDAASIVGDWMAPGQAMPASLNWISPTADFPPSSTTTEDTHLTRAVQVELLATGELPAGVPVEISIPGCHPAAGQSAQDR